MKSAARVLVVLFLGSSVACSGRTSVEGSVRSSKPVTAAAPSVEEIFAHPPLTGRGPLIEEWSADGRYLLFRWSPPEELVDGGQATLRLLDCDRPETSDYRGVPLESLLPPAPLLEPEGGSDVPLLIGPTQFSPSGHTLAIGRGRELFLLDPESGRLMSVLAEPAREEGGTQGRKLVAIRGLRFAPPDESGGEALRFTDNQELYSIPVDASFFPARPYTLDEVDWWSEDIDGAAQSLAWNKDLSLAFGQRTLPKKRPQVDKGEAPPVAQVYLVREERQVALDGMALLGSTLENPWLSPDGRFVIGFQVEDGGGGEPLLLPDYLSKRVSVREFSRRSAGDRAPRVRVLAWRTSSGRRSSIWPPPNAGATEAGERVWAQSIGWAAQTDERGPARYAFELWSEDFRELSIYVWTEGFLERVWFEQDAAWIGGSSRYAGWTADGKSLLVGSESHAASSTPGRSQVFAVDPDSKAVRQLTFVGGEVSRYLPTADGGVLFVASFEDPAEQDCAYLSARELAAERPVPRRFTVRDRRARGFSDASFRSREGGRVLFLREGLLDPAEIYVAGDDEEPRAITRTVPDGFERFPWILPELLEVESADGRRIRAHVYLPDGMTLAERPAAARAGVVFVHGSGYLQNVTASMTQHPENALFHARLARLGYPVIDVDYRGSAGYGRDFRTDVKGHLGGKDLEDVNTVVDELAARGIVDSERVAIYGSSYGGFLALMALFTASDRWVAGAALGPVADWRNYLAHYAQPRLGRPDDNPDGYRRSSPIDHVDGLEDPLLLLHGLRDGNVLAQDTIRLMESLIDSGADFEALLYPSQGHNFDDGRHAADAYKRIEGFLLENLGTP